MQTKEEIAALTRVNAPEEIVSDLLQSTVVAACPDSRTYAQFKASIYCEFPDCEMSFIAGSGNWGFSMNPEKNFKVFDDRSDIDVGIVDPLSYARIWRELRAFHRRYYYKISQEPRNSLRRNGENIYSGFISPKWIPSYIHPVRLENERVCNRLSNELVGYKPVRLLFFNSFVETVDYYKRGLNILSRKLT